MNHSITTERVATRHVDGDTLLETFCKLLVIAPRKVCTFFVPKYSENLFTGVPFRV